jgi:UrcA family protein
MNRNTLGKFVTATAVALVGFAAANAALAAEPGTTSITVSYADLDLGKPQGVDTLYARLKGAAKAACGDTDARNLREKALVRECRDEALASAVKGVNHAALTAMHRQHSPERVAQLEPRSDRS